MEVQTTKKEEQVYMSKGRSFKGEYNSIFG